MKKIYTPLTEECICSLKVGDQVSLSGIIYTGRDLAHQELTQAIKKKKKLPINLQNQIIYYCGPTLPQKNKPIGSCGPTTSSRMDPFTEDLLKIGLKGMIGKGSRSLSVQRAIKRYKAVYFLTIAGAGALLSSKVKRSKVVAYPKFGPEAIRKLEVEDFPLIVAIDSRGRSIFQ